MGMLGACFIKILLDPAFFKVFLNGACAVCKISQCALLQITPQGRIGFDVNVNDVKPYSRTTYANNVKFSKLGAGTTAILNISYASYSRGNYAEKAERKLRKKMRRWDVRF